LQERVSQMSNELISIYSASTGKMQPMRTHSSAQTQQLEKE
jgi:hypothetical protein